MPPQEETATFVSVLSLYEADLVGTLSLSSLMKHPRRVGFMPDLPPHPSQGPQPRAVQTGDPHEGWKGAGGDWPLAWESAGILTLEIHRWRRGWFVDLTKVTQLEFRTGGN